MQLDDQYVRLGRVSRIQTQLDSYRKDGFLRRDNFTSCSLRIETGLTQLIVMLSLLCTCSLCKRWIVPHLMCKWRDRFALGANTLNHTDTSRSLSAELLTVTSYQTTLPLRPIHHSSTRYD